MWERMTGRAFVFIVFILKNSEEYAENVGNPECDSSTSARFKEGNIGESSLFCWLGVLRVHFHHGDVTQVALSGVVLIKNNFALGNAEDIAKIPEFVLTHDSKVMFIDTEEQPTELDVARRYVHPDYDLYTQQSVALLELYVENIDFRMRSVCWPSYLYNASSVLYAFGYTDENKLLEKVAYKMQYLNPTLCEEFYNKSGLQVQKSRKSMDMHVCGFAVNMQKRCVWDSGMVLASNATGAWIIVGLSIHGPGCAAPSRFLDVMPYFPWIHEVTKPGYGFRRKSDEDGFVATPVHDLFKETRKFRTDSRVGKEDDYHIPVETQGWLNIDRLDKEAYRITPFDNRYETNGGCTGYDKTLLYREQTRVVTEYDRPGHLAYKINLYNMLITGCDCILLTVKCTARSKAVVYHSHNELDMHEGVGIPFPETPNAVIRHYPIRERIPKGQTRRTPLPRMQPTFIRDDLIRTIAPNVNLFIRIEFKGEGSINFQMYGPLKRSPRTTTVSTTTKYVRTTRRLRRIGDFKWREVEKNVLYPDNRQFAESRLPKSAAHQPERLAQCRPTAVVFVAVIVRSLF